MSRVDCGIGAADKLNEWKQDYAMKAPTKGIFRFLLGG